MYFYIFNYKDWLPNKRNFPLPPPLPFAPYSRQAAEDVERCLTYDNLPCHHITIESRTYKDTTFPTCNVNLSKFPSFYHSKAGSSISVHVLA
ncbi:hypothetical protein E2C01_040813 [Portunus trituberculatus]|uniref:Uncharacterized protein n=1 Tax=Portunus trituberculatus TaxID=210409 RepID=A0A5B7FQ79_PORTR|nr:hypothetical protein [Portunus trituberculatus]